jgi:phage shock protein C
MFCTKCGVALDDKVNFCPDCGTNTRTKTLVSRSFPRLSRPRDERKIAGVCAGFARYLAMDVTLVRLVAVILAVWPVGLGLIAYLVAWIVMPNDPLQFPAARQAEPANGHA